MKMILRGCLFSTAFLMVMFPLSASLEERFSGMNPNCEAAGGPTRIAPASQKAAQTSGSYGDREQLAKESALNLKEQELKKMSASLDARMKELDEKRKAMESSLAAGNKVSDERFKKMIKLYKSLPAEEAAGLLDKMDEETAFEMLDRMDTKTAAKLVPFLNQKKVLKWTRLNLRGN